jgi:hypothetical protein
MNFPSSGVMYWRSRAGRWRRVSSAYNLASVLDLASLAASDSEEAVRLCTQYAGPIHLRLTDLVMPGMSGPALASRLELPRAFRLTLGGVWSSDTSSNTYLAGAGVGAFAHTLPTTRAAVLAGVRMRCPCCESYTPDGSKFCIECGLPLRPRCSQDGADMLPRAKFCGECGTPLGGQPERHPPHVPSHRSIILQVIWSRRF